MRTLRAERFCASPGWNHAPVAPQETGNRVACLADVRCSRTMV